MCADAKGPSAGEQTRFGGSGAGREELLDCQLTRSFAQTRWPAPLRHQQVRALSALEDAWQHGRRRASVVLPPGAGKTLVGLEAARRLGRRVVVFGPNTAIQGQWVAAWSAYTPATATAGTDRDLSAAVTSLTYQSLASFDPDSEVDEDGRDTGGWTRRHHGGDSSVLDQLHPNGKELVAALRAAGPLTVVLDECHHLLEVWGRLLEELLDSLPDAYVLALTATPPSALRPDQVELVRALFGDPVYDTSIPAVVRDGHLAPFAELAWLTVPTAAEADWLAGQAERFTELTTDLLHPDFARRGFLAHLDARFVQRGSDAPGALPVSWARVERDDPELAAAALRFTHAGLLALPPGARLREEHRHDPTAGDWVRLIDDYVTTYLAASSDELDQRAYARLRAALPSVGYQLTRRGVRAGRSPVDRVLARSEAKTRGAVEIAAVEHAALGDRARVLVLADHEKATATLPAALVGVLSAEAGSARLALEQLVTDARTAGLHPMLVTGSTVAAGRDTAAAFVAFARSRRPGLRLDDVPSAAAGADPSLGSPSEDVVEVTGTWSPRTWVPLVTAFFEAGRCQVLVGTRGLLGEGWDAQGVNVLVDLTTATTSTAVVQTRGRALRVDPTWPEKVSNTWSVVTVTDAHPNGAADWDRLVRKHAGYLALDADGTISDGVAHLHPEFSPYAPPPVEAFDRLNAAMLARAEDRTSVRDGWQVGTPYADALVHTVRITRRRPAPPTDAVVPDPVALTRPESPWLLPGPRGLVRLDPCPDPSHFRVSDAAPAAAATVATLLVPGTHWLVAGGVAVASVGATRGWTTTGRAARLLAGVAPDPGVLPFAYAVADALQGLGLSPRGAEAISVSVDPRGSYRVALTGVAPSVSALFATSLDEVLSPLAAPRYVVPRYLAPTPPQGRIAARAAARAWLAGRGEVTAVVYHTVPTELGTRADRAAAFARAWSRWVSPAAPVRTATPEGEGILVTHRGADPLDATTALRVSWQ